MRQRASWLIIVSALMVVGSIGLDEASAQRGFGGFRGGFGGRGFAPGGFARRDAAPRNFAPRAFTPHRGRDFAGTPHNAGPTRTPRGDIGRGNRLARDGGTRGRGHINIVGHPPRAPERPIRVVGRKLPRRIVTLPRLPRVPIVALPPVTEPRPLPPLAPGLPLAGANPNRSTPPQGGGGGGTPVAGVVPQNRPPVDLAFKVPDVNERRYVPNEILVTTNGQIPSDRLALLEQRFGLTPLASTHINLLDVDVRRYRLSDSTSVRGAILALRGTPEVRSAQPNFVFQLQDDAKGQQALVTKPETPETPLPSDDAAVEPQRPVQYAIDAMKLDGAHRMATGTDVLIAIIDTGLDETHPEIAGRVVDRFDTVGGTFRPLSHGTAMAGVIVAHRDLVGIAPDAKLLAIRAFESIATGSGEGTSYDIVRGLDFAADHHAQIVNMSFAGPRDEILAEALAKARSQGMIEIAAAGNGGPDAEPLYPGAEPGVIAVTATDTHNRLFLMANRGDYVAVAAPGVDVIAPSTGGAMQLTSGTSVAAAEASGVVALLLQAHPNIGADEVRKVLGDTAIRLSDQPGPPTELIDALAALRAEAH